MPKFAFFVCSNGGYLPFLNVLLNSIAKQNCHIDTYLLYYDFPEKYIEDATSKMPYPLIPLEIKREDFNIADYNKNNNNLFIKQARFKYIREYGVKYDAICMLDADMFITTPNFMNLFDLVNGTRKLIACNERFKWMLDSRFSFNGKPIFEKPIKAYKFHCSVPLVFDMKEWIEVFDFYNELAFNAFETDASGKITKPAGDIYCWNISVYKNDRQNDVVLFPMETMTQVHHTYAHPWTELTKDNGTWITYAGDEVFSIHGRIGNKSWFEGQVRGARKRYRAHNIQDSDEEVEDKVGSVLRRVQKEWYDLNFKEIINLYDYVPVDKYWESFDK